MIRSFLPSQLNDNLTRSTTTQWILLRPNLSRAPLTWSKDSLDHTYRQAIYQHLLPYQPIYTIPSTFLYRPKKKTFFYKLYYPSIFQMTSRRPTTQPKPPNLSPQQVDPSYDTILAIAVATTIIIILLLTVIILTVYIPLVSLYRVCTSST